MLYMAAMTAARGDPTMHAVHERLTQHGKPGNVILVACMRKLLTIANAILRDGVPWQASAVVGG
jgi:transposase